MAQTEISCLRAELCKSEAKVAKLTIEIEQMKRENDLQVTLADAKQKKLKQNLKVRVSSYQKIIITIVPLDIPSRTVISQLGQLSLASLRGRLIEYQLRLGVTAGM